MIKLRQIISEAGIAQLGLRKERVVIEGPNVVNTKEEILANCVKHDPEAKLEFYPKTGKIVGVMAKVKIEFVKRDLKQIDKSARIIIKPIEKSLTK